jgi:hypothetical protein
MLFQETVRFCLIQDGFGDFFLSLGVGPGIGCGLVVYGKASLPAAGGGVAIRGSTTAGGAICIVSLSPVAGGTTIAPEAAGSRGAFGPVCATASSNSPHDMPINIIAAAHVFAFMLFS